MNTFDVQKGVFLFNGRSSSSKIEYEEHIARESHVAHIGTIELTDHD